MSNGLWTLAQATGPTQPTSTPADQTAWPEGLYLVMAIGVVLGLVWLARRIAFPRKFSLVNTPARPNDVHPLLLVGLFVLFAAMQSLAAWFWQTRFGQADVDQTKARILAACTTQVVFFGVCAALAYRLFRRGLGRGCGLTLRRWPIDSFRGATALLIALPICIALLALTNWAIRQLFQGQPERIEQLTGPHTFIEALLAMPKPWRVGIFISAAVLAPLSEELFFRGFVQSSLRQATGSPWLGIIVAATFFAAVHAEWNAKPALLFLGLVMGYNYERTGRLWPAVVIHALFNATFLLLTLRMH